MRGRLKRHAALLALLGLATLGARWDYDANDTLAALETASARTACVIGYETGFSYSPNLVGAAGEVGAAQLLPYGGLLSDFYAKGYTDPWNPYEAVEYADRMIEAGYGSNWTPILWGYC